jgi:hypothetical protein
MAVRDEASDATTQDKPSDNLFFRLARDYLALLVPIIGALIFAFRCIIVSEGDPYVAFILASQTSVGDAIRALLFTVTPILLFLLAYVAAFAGATQITQGNWRSLKGAGMAVASVPLVIGWLYLGGYFTGRGREGSPTGALPGFLPTYPSWIMAGVTAILPLFSAWLLVPELEKWRWRRLTGERGIGLAELLFFPVAVSAFFVGSVLLGVGPALGEGTFWLPRERLVFQNEAPFTGYVLKVSEEHLIILNDRPRIIVQKPKATLQDRDFCYPEGHKARSSKVAADSPVCP